jgi:hypothetical protein
MSSERTMLASCRSLRDSVPNVLLDFSENDRGVDVSGLQGIVDHGGRAFDVTSEQGGGATFRILLPAMRRTAIRVVTS